MKKLIAKILNFLFNHGNKHPYLEEIGIHSYPANHFGGIQFPKPFATLCNLRKQKRIKKKTKVDPRDCWELEGSFYMWLYEHLTQYLKDTENFINLEYHTFEHNRKTYTQKAYIEYLQNLCKQMLMFDEFKDCPELSFNIESEEDDGTVKWNNSEEELKLHGEIWKKNIENNNSMRKELCTVWCDLLPYMWW